MKEIKNPALASKAKAQGLNTYNVVSLSPIKAHNKKFPVVRQPAVQGVVCEQPFLLKQPQNSGKATRWAKQAHAATAGFCQLTWMWRYGTITEY